MGGRKRGELVPRALEQPPIRLYHSDTKGLGPPAVNTNYFFSVQQEALLMASFSPVIKSSK